MDGISVRPMTVGEVMTNCYLVYGDEKRAVVIDPGDGAERISMECRGLGIRPEAIILTHGHFDHIMAADALRQEWGMKIYACEKERQVLEDASLSLVLEFTGRPYSLKADVYVKEGDIIDAGGMRFKVMETPGHTVGSCCYYMEGEDILFSGDTLFHLSCGRVDFPTGSGRMIKESLKRLFNELPEATKVYPGHEGVTEIGFEKKYNPFAR